MKKIKNVMALFEQNPDGAPANLLAAVQKLGGKSAFIGKVGYVLGLEPSNCTVDGRDINRKNGLLKELKPNEMYKTNLKIEFVENINKLEE